MKISWLDCRDLESIDTCNKVKNFGFCVEDILDLGLAQKCNATCGKCGKFHGQCINA